MAERSGFFNSQQTGGSYDRTYSADDFSNVFRQFLGNGIMVTDEEAEENTVFDKTTCNGLKPSLSGTSSVQIAPGFAFINGYWYHNDSIATKAIQSSWESRLLVLQFATATRQITLEFIPNAGSLTQTEDIYQIPIALVQRSGSVFTVTDTREDFITASLKVIQNITNKIKNSLSEYPRIYEFHCEAPLKIETYSDANYPSVKVPLDIILDSGNYMLHFEFDIESNFGDSNDFSTVRLQLVCLDKNDAVVYSRYFEDLVLRGGSRETTMTIDKMISMDISDNVDNQVWNIRVNIVPLAPALNATFAKNYSETQTEVSYAITKYYA